MECYMPTSYNLRSTQRKRNCYLQNFSGNDLPNTYNPKVCLKRLKFPECHDINSSTFYLEKGRITVKQNKSILSKKKFLLKLCTVAFLITTLMFYQDYLRDNGIDFVKKYAEIHSIQNYYYAAVKFHKNIIKKFKYNQQKSNNKKPKPVFRLSKFNSSLEQENLEIQQLVRDYFIEVKKKYNVQNSGNSPQSFIEEQCRRDVSNNSLVKKKKFENVTYHDMTNLTDYALHSQGAKIVTVFDTELYGIITVKYLNINLWPHLTHFLMRYLKCFRTNGPDSILIPWKKPGDCWAFKGSSGRAQIKLSDVIIISAVTVEHIPKEVNPRGNIQSAPKKFSLFGIEEAGNENKKTYLGSYQYEISGPAAQTFFIQPRVEVPFGIVEVFFESNHGNDIYTCVYKIRVHGLKLIF